MADSKSTTVQSTTTSTIAQRESMLRRVAVVLSSLPAPTATKLLSNVSSQARHVIHQAVATLPPIGTKEREAVVDSFANRIRSDISARIMSSVNRPGGVQDEIVIGQPTDSIDHHESAHLRSFGQIGSVESTAVPSPFAFLENTPATQLVELLKGEHPQTIALVLASVSPKQATDVLPALDTRLQTETLSRIGRLDEVHEETVAELADHLQHRLSEQTAAETVSSGKRALQAIIAELPELEQHTKHAQPQEPAEPKPLFDANQQFDSYQPTDTYPPTNTNPVAAPNQADVTHGLRIAPQTQTPPRAVPHHEPSESFDNQTELRIHDSDSAHRSDTRQTDEIVDEEKVQSYLVDMAPERLVSALGKVSTRQAFLTLCGLPNKTSERAIALLPRAKAKTVRRSIAQLSDLQLSEIDDAKEAVAKVAFKLETDHKTRAA